ncbi:MAG TPA: hypothetical protein O0X73_01145 [Methanocorpusculum sp.]|nr:hypothetical protein [Methanocorpusculum sp.]
MAEIIIVSTPVSSVAHDILEEIFTLHMLDLVFDALSFMLPVLSLLHHLVEAGFRKHMRSYAEWYHQTE